MWDTPKLKIIKESEVLFLIFKPLPKYLNLKKNQSNLSKPHNLGYHKEPVWVLRDFWTILKFFEIAALPVLAAKIKVELVLVLGKKGKSYWKLFKKITFTEFVVFMATFFDIKETDTPQTLLKRLHM
jgi:hypothetical protein